MALKAGDTAYTKKLLWCEVGGTALFEQHGVYKGYSGKATACVVAFCSDEFSCWHCKKSINFGDDYATAHEVETFCLDCVTDTEPVPQFQTEKHDLGYE